MTLSGKLALYLKSKMNKRPLLVACDVYRPAAIDQLGVLAEQVNVDVFLDRENKNPVEIEKNAIQHAKKYSWKKVSLGFEKLLIFKNKH